MSPYLYLNTQHESLQGSGALHPAVGGTVEGYMSPVAIHIVAGLHL